MMEEATDYMEKARQLVEQALEAVESKEKALLIKDLEFGTVSRFRVTNSDVMALALLAIAVALIGLGKEDQGSR